MRRTGILLLIVSFVMLFCSIPCSAVIQPVTPITPITPIKPITPVLPPIRPGTPPSTGVITPSLPGTLRPILPILQAKPPVNVAFSVVSNRYTDLDPATTFDLNGDMVGDLQVSASTLTGKNGALIQKLDPDALSLDSVYSVPSTGYSQTAAVQLSRVYVMQLPGNSYVKFMIIQATPKVTIWFHYGTPTPSVLKADGTNGHAVLTWGALPDAAVGYNVYRYEMLDNNSYTVTLLNDFTVQDTTFTDDTAQNHYYLYVVIAMKSGGAFGSSTTVAPIQVQSLQRSMVFQINSASAKLDGSSVTLAAHTVIKNGRLMVPASSLTHAGIKVAFDSTSQKLTLTRRLDAVTYTMVMTLDTPDYTWNGSSYKMDVPPYKSGSEIMVPLRVAAPGLAFGLTFDSTSRVATMTWFE